MRGKRTSNLKWRDSHGITRTCSCPDCRDAISMTRRREKQETAREILDQLAPPLPYEPEGVITVPYRIWEDADPSVDAWRWYIRDPDADPVVVDGIVTHLEQNPDCTCDFWTPNTVEHSLNPWKRFCARCERRMPRWNSDGKSPVYDDDLPRILFGEAAGSNVDDPIIDAIWNYLIEENGWVRDENLIVCGCCWKRLVTEITGY